MIKPRQEDVEKFRDFSVEDFDSWLRTALESYRINGQGIAKFAPVEYCILVEHTLAADLANVYAEFPAHQKAKLRQVIAQLIDRLPADQKYIPVFEDLLGFAVKVQAHEILRKLPAKGEGFLGIEPQHPDVETLYSRTLNAVAELADRSPQASDCMDRLIGTPGAFAFEHARKALITLCKIKREDFALHMTRMREPLMRSFKAHPPTKRAIQSLVDDIVKAVGLFDIQNSWPLLQISDWAEGIDETGEIQIFGPNDNWFRDELVPRLETRGESNGTKILVVKERLDTSVAVLRLRRHVGGESDTDDLERADELRRAQALYNDMPDTRVDDGESQANAHMIVLLFGTYRAPRHDQTEAQ